MANWSRARKGEIGDKGSWAEASFLEENNKLLGKNLIRLTSSALEMADIYFVGNRLVFWVWICLSAQRVSDSTIKG